MTNIVMIAKDRQRLTQQALESLLSHTDPYTYTLVVVDDGSKEPISLREWVRWIDNAIGITKESDIRPNAVTIRVYPSRGIIGLARNLGAWFSERYWGRGDRLYFSDNDVYFCEGWLEKMTTALSLVDEYEVRVLGGYRHPFHGVNNNIPIGRSERMLFDGRRGDLVLDVDDFIQTADAVAGYSMLMRWETWDRFGPFDAHAVGVCQSEDYALCRKVVDAGGQVGYIHPPVIHNCGITNTLGQPAIGHEVFPRVPGLIYE